MLLYFLVPMTSPYPTVYPTMVFKNRLILIGTTTRIAFNRVSYILTCTFEYREMMGNTIRRNLPNWCNLITISKKLRFYVLEVKQTNLGAKKPKHTNQMLLCRTFWKWNYHNSLLWLRIFQWSPAQHPFWISHFFPRPWS